MGKALKQTLQKAQKMGRRGDKILAHITSEEARLLKARGGSGTVNPRTGLPEFWMDDDDDDETTNNDSNYSFNNDSDSSSWWDSNSEDESDSSWTAPAGERPASGDWWEVDFNGDGYVTDWNHPSNQSQTSESGSSNNQATAAPPPPPPTPQESLTAELSSWGGTEEQIQAIMNSLGETSDADLTTLLNQLKEVPKEERIVHLIDNFGDAVQEWGGAGGTQPIPLNDATRGAELQKSPEERLQAAVDLEVMGSSTGKGLDDNGDGSFTDPESEQFTTRIKTEPSQIVMAMSATILVLDSLPKQKISETKNLALPINSMVKRASLTRSKLWVLIITSL